MQFKAAGLLAGVLLAAAAVLVAGSSTFVYEPVPVPTIAVTTPIPRQRSTPTPTPTFTATQREALTRTLRDYLDGRPGSLSLSVRDLTTGISYSYGKGLRTATASIVKVDIVMALLLKAQRRERPLTSAEKGLAERAITLSDNAAASALWHAIGGSAGLASANEELGLRDTDPGPGGAWGSTETSAADQIRLLTALISPESPLAPDARRYVRRLMRDVAPDQAWGVSAAGADAEVKNGWLPRDVHGGRWTVTSIGIVRNAGHRYLIAAVSERHPTMRDGIEAIEHTAETVTEALTKTAPAER
ncbi:serine hydrolase [Actinomadura sp. 1N219]|uniref:serine hydrolase n=1 Tax=Actinomadura sp. 1N219 TaxID=3375152 RepID=UPI0037BCC363